MRRCQWRQLMTDFFVLIRFWWVISSLGHFCDHFRVSHQLQALQVLLLQGLSPLLLLYFLCLWHESVWVMIGNEIDDECSSEWRTDQIWRQQRSHRVQ